MGLEDRLPLRLKRGGSNSVTIYSTVASLCSILRLLERVIIKWIYRRYTSWEVFSLKIDRSLCKEPNSECLLEQDLHRGALRLLDLSVNTLP